MRLEAMAVKIPHVDGHPTGCRSRGIDGGECGQRQGSGRGARTPRYADPRGGGEGAALAIGMAVDYRPGWDGHDARRKIGLLTEADIAGQRLVVRGYLYARDFPEVAGAIHAMRQRRWV